MNISTSTISFEFICPLQRRQAGLLRSFIQIQTVKKSAGHPATHSVKVCNTDNVDALTVSRANATVRTAVFGIYSHLQPAEAGGELAGATGDHSSNGKIGRFLSTKRKTQGKLRKPTGRCFSGFSESLTVLYNVLDARDY